MTYRIYSGPIHSSSERVLPVCCAAPSHAHAQTATAPPGRGGGPAQDPAQGAAGSVGSKAPGECTPWQGLGTVARDPGGLPAMGTGPRCSMLGQWCGGAPSGCGHIHPLFPPLPPPLSSQRFPPFWRGGGCVLPFTHAPRSGSPPPLPLPHLSVWQGPPNQCTLGLWGHRAPAPGTASRGGSIIPQDRQLLRVCSFPRAGGRGRGACPATLALASCATLGRDLRHSVPLIPH